MNTNVNLAYFTVLIIAVAGLLIYLAVRSGSGYSVEDTKAHAEKFAGNIEEGHGGMTGFAWVTIGALIVWSLIYLVMHWNQYSVVFFR